MLADTLVAYVVYFGKVKDSLQSAKMEKIDAGVRAHARVQTRR